MLEGAFRLMAALDGARTAGVTRLAAESGLPKTTAYRLLEQLVALGAVERQGARYRMGPRMFRLGHSWQPYPGLRVAAREPVRRLVAATGATAGVSVLREGRTLVLDWTAGRDTSLAPLLDGASWPWFTAAGKVQLAGRPKLPLDPLPASWPREAAAILHEGVAFDREQVVAGVCCAAVPLYGSGGALVGALAVLAAPGQHLERLAETARQTGRAVSANLRRRPHGGGGRLATRPADPTGRPGAGTAPADVRRTPPAVGRANARGSDG